MNKQGMGRAENQHKQVLFLSLYAKHILMVLTQELIVS